MTPVRVDLSEWEQKGPLEGLSFGRGEKVRALAAAFDKAGILSVTELAEGLSIRTYSHIGSLRLGPLEIRIRPKIQGAPLLALLRYAYGLRDLRLLDTHHSALSRSTFQDLLLHQLAAETNELLARGLHRQYRRRDEPLASPRGRFDFGRIARGAGVVEATLPCRHHVRSENCLPNQVLLAGLRSGVRLTQDLALRSRLRRGAALLAEYVDPVELNRRTFRRLERERSRLLHAYIPAFRLVELIAAGQGVALRGEESDLAVPGFLFDMNRFFQQLLSRFLRENLTAYGFRDEYRLKGVFAYLPGFNPADRRAPVPRPDYVVMSGTRVRAVLDAKYRDLWLRPIPREMLYQLAIYALGQPDVRESAILYPTMSEGATEARMEIRDPVHGGARGVIALRPVNLKRLASAVSGAEATILGARELATELAFGTHS